MNELIRYLLSNIVLDFQGEISLEQVRSMLREDGSREARVLLEKLTQDHGVDDMLITLADALKGQTPVVTGHYRLGDVRHITADSSRLRKELDWKPSVEFAAGMAELARG